MLGTLNPAARVLDASSAYAPAGQALYYPAGQGASPAVSGPQTPAQPRANYSPQTWQPYDIGSEDFRREGYMKMVTASYLLGGGAVIGLVAGIIAGLRKP